MAFFCAFCAILLCLLSIASAAVSLCASAISVVFSSEVSWLCVPCAVDDFFLSGVSMLSLNEALRVRALFRSLGTLSAVARVTGHDIKTIRRVLNRDYSVPMRRRRSVSMDSRLADLIIANRSALNLNHKNRLTPARAHELLSSVGYSVSLRTVERRFKVVSERLGAAVERPASLLLSPPPGAFQVDFGLVDAILSGVSVSLSLLICSSAYSNGCAAVACRCQDSSNLFWGLDHCFIQLGGVPPFLRFDNLAPAISCFRKGKQKTDAFTRFECHHGFDSEFCNPASGWEKGNVENKVQYIRERFFVPVPVVSSLSDLNHALSVWCREDMRRNHYAKGRLISDLFVEDQASFLPFVSPFDYVEIIGARADSRGFVSYRSCHYFVDERSACRSVIIHGTVDNVEIYSQDGELLNCHARSYQSGVFIQSSDDLARQLSHKLNALGNIGRDRADGLRLRDALRALNASERMPFIRRFLDGERLSDILESIEAQRAPLFKYNALLQHTKDHGK